MNNKIKTFLVLSLLLILFSCKEEKKKNTPDNRKNNTEKEIKNPLKLTIDKPEKENYIFGDKIKISAETENFQQKDTIILFINNKQAAFLSFENKSFIWDTKNNGHCGKNTVEIELIKENNRFRKQKFVTVVSGIKPEKQTYKVKSVYKHDVHAYTQGLFYHNGFLYEATGLKGESTVRKVKLETGEVMQSFAIPEDVFGEGITLFDNKIVQISWQAGRGFVYEFNTFNQIDEFSYSGEGWGICTDGKYLYMTNGSSEVKVLEPQTYSVVKTFNVFDNEGEVKYLNELEYINGYIFANIYQYERIVKFEPETGRVIADIDMSDILPMNDYKPDTDVLNGIAFDEENNRIFVTGKLWPKLFEVEFVKK